MAIIIEASRKQVFAAQIEPMDFVKCAMSAETLTSLTSDELRILIDAMNMELNARENENDK